MMLEKTDGTKEDKHYHEDETLEAWLATGDPNLLLVQHHESTLANMYVDFSLGISLLHVGLNKIKNMQQL